LRDIDATPTAAVPVFTESERIARSAPCRRTRWANRSTRLCERYWSKTAALALSAKTLSAVGFVTGIIAAAGYNGAAVSSPQPALAVTYPGARAPDRRRDVFTSGVRLAVYEWGDAKAPPLALVHGGFDFARTFDVFAPLLAAAGYRVVCWDHRGHGDSEHADLYSWHGDGCDLAAVMDSISPEPFAVVGHSKGGALLMRAIAEAPRRFSRFVAIDGLPIRPPEPALSERQRERMCQETAGWLDHRRTVTELERRPGSLDELATRRAQMNPRLSHDWLRYLVQQGARLDPDGWRWKIDASLRMLRFGPWRWLSYAPQLRAIQIPLLALVGSEEEPMGWGLTAADIEPHMPKHAQLVVMDATGHFIHIERPHDTAALVLDFLQS
jgi:pimeloyl-ACP methyl ester carboxylesterase